jgi:rod shape determining protein RodA
MNNFKIALNAMHKFFNLDKIMVRMLVFLAIINVFVQYSANDKILFKVANDIVYLLISALVLVVIANFNVAKIKHIIVPLYIISLVLLVLVIPFGSTIHGARRWLSLGIKIQPSELCKLSVPLILAYYYSLKNHIIKAHEYFVGFILILIPFALIAKQPDLGTGILVFCAGFFVIFFAGLPWRVILMAGVVFGLSTPVLWHFMLHDYQKHRILTLLNPESDPLGTGYHIIQGIIAIGSGGLWGKGYLHGTQIHLDFIPEKHTDFVISVLAEEFGYIGICLLLTIYLVLILRSMRIVTQTDDLFSRLIGISITLSFTLYVLINMGMVSGIFPVVGVPLPFISYGGTAMIVLSIGFGIILAIAKQNHYEKL